MQIETVKETENGGYLVNGTLSVPNAASNRHYQELMEWVAEGNTIAPYVAPPAPPISVTPWQFRKALNRSGKRKQIEEYIAAPTTGQDVKDGFEYATAFVENVDFIIAACQTLGISEAERKQLFELAATL